MLLPFIQLLISIKCLTDAIAHRKEATKGNRQMNQHFKHLRQQDIILPKKNWSVFHTVGTQLRRKLNNKNF